MIDVHYDAMERDWRGEMAGVDDFLGLDMAPALPDMERYQYRTGI